MSDPSINKIPVKFKQPTELGPLVEKSSQAPEVAEKKEEKFEVPKKLLDRISELDLKVLKFDIEDAMSAEKAEWYINRARQRGEINEEIQNELAGYIDSKAFNPELSQNVDEQFASARDEYIDELELFYKELRGKKVGYDDLISELVPGGKQRPVIPLPDSLIKARMAYQEIARKRNKEKISSENFRAEFERREQERTFIYDKIRDAMSDEDKAVLDKAIHNWADSFRYNVDQMLVEESIPEAVSEPKPEISASLPDREIATKNEVAREAVIANIKDPSKIISVEKEPEDENWLKVVIKPEMTEVKFSKTSKNFEVVSGEKLIAKGEIVDGNAVFSVQPPSKGIFKTPEEKIFEKARIILENPPKFQ